MNFRKKTGVACHVTKKKSPGILKINEEFREKDRKNKRARESKRVEGDPFDK